MKLFVCFFVFVFISCENPDSNTTVPNRGINHKPIFPDNVKRCDDCICELLVRHEESTGTIDFVVDSGTIYLPTEIYDIILKLYSIDPTLERPVNLKDFGFFPYYDYNKLWADSNSVIGFRKYRITGKVSRLIYTKHVKSKWPIEMYFSLLTYKSIN